MPWITKTAVLFALLCISVFGNAYAVKYGSKRSEQIDMIVIHSTGGPTCDEATGKPIWVKAGTLEENLRNIEANPKLGIHYMIDRDGTVRTSVPEDRFTNHVFKYSGRSIAIELVNDGDGHDPFPKAQIDALVKLLKDITRRRGIVRDGIKRHSDLDHGMLECDKKQRRKVDPGAAFPYKAVLDRVFAPDR
ncbi:MAG TPA: peptidoglycan recognition family protein [Gallionella sp.]|nr:peptidoglycan recognition family protein [Gallionella sp.]